MRSKFPWVRTALLVSAGLALPTLIACLDHPIKPVALDSESTTKEGIPLSVNRDVDILFVIDNSGSMGEEQRYISENFRRFIEQLEAEDVKANYRIGVTTTDVENPGCARTTPENGKLRAQSCVDRIEEFTFVGGNSGTVVREDACTDFCDGSIETTDGKPWIESIEGVTNLPAGVTTTQAFQCFGPQGINGCGMESHLEAMRKFFWRATAPSEPEFGFVRPNAILAVIFLTDELDCSFNPNYGSQLFGGRNVFWDQAANGLLSSVCWNAGVECTGDDGVYSECHSVNKDIDGNVGVSDEVAVLNPVQEYIDAIQQLEDHKRGDDFDQEVLVAVIGGVPQDYPAVDIPYRNADDDVDQVGFGIGFGCDEGEDARAVPPVRLREFADAFAVDDQPNLFSVCNDDFGPALAEIAQRIADQVKPACMPACVSDSDLTTTALDPDCTVTQYSGGSSEPIGECTYLCGGVAGDGCDRTNADEVVMPEGASVCFKMLSDNSGEKTPGNLDDMSQPCQEGGYNLEFEILREGGVPPDTAVRAACLLSKTETIECPDLN